MIPFIHASQDPFGIYGRDHFLQKYGIFPSGNGQGGSGITVWYGGGGTGGFSIRIEENPVGKDVAGSVRAQGRDTPVFQTPRDTGEEGRVMARFTGAGGDFPCITETEGGIHIGLDIFGETGRLLSGHMEGIWKGPRGALAGSLAGIPVVDRLEELLFSSLLTACRRMGIPLVTQPLWPGDRPYAVCLTHDVDEVRKTYQWITHPLRLAGRLDGRGLYHQALSLLEKIGGREPYWTFDAIRQVEEEFGGRSSFFFLKETAGVKMTDTGSWRHRGRKYAWDEAPVKDLIRELVTAGWDVGLHGSFYSYRDASLLDGERRDLERVKGGRVTTTRQHNLNLEIPETWLYQERSGLECDTTLGFNDRIGFRWGTCFPFRPFHPREGRSLGVTEVPLIIEETALFTLPHPREEWTRALDTVRGCGGVLTLLWHPVVFNEHEFPGWGGTYREILGRCREDGAWITSATEIASWWNGRHEARFPCRYRDHLLEVGPSPDGKQHLLLVHVPPGLRIGTLSGGTFSSADPRICRIQTEPDPEHRPLVMTFTEVDP